MVYEVGIVAQFEAAHRLSGDFGAASHLHGHTYRVDVSVRGESLGTDGTLCDIGSLRSQVGAIIERLDYQNLDEVADLAGQNTTAEVVARLIHDWIAPNLPSGVIDTLAVRVWESPSVWAGYEARIAEATPRAR